MPDRDITRAARRWVVPAVVGAVAILLVAVVVSLQRESSDEEAGSPSGSSAPRDVPVREERRDPDDLLAVGPLDAPVGLVVFSDYQCPYCASWSDETLPQMMEYVEAGDLRIEWRDVNVFGEPSERAARASYAAALQDSFWEYHGELFAGGEHRSAGELSEQALIELAEELGLDGDRFASDMASPDTAEEIARNAELGLNTGAFSTPTFLLDGQLIVGAHPTQVFLDELETALGAGTG